MEFNQKQLKIKSITPAQERKPARFGKKIAGAAATVLAAFMLASPLVSTSARAEGGSKASKGSDGSAEIVPLYSDEEAEAALRAAAKNPNYTKEQREEAQKAADELAAKRSAKKAGKTTAKKKETAAGKEVEPFDVDEAIAKMDALGKTSVDAPGQPIESGESAPAPVGPAETEEPGTMQEPKGEEVAPGAGEIIAEEESAASHNILFSSNLQELGKYLRANLIPMPGMVGKRGQDKKSGLEQPIDVGVNALGNEAGHAMFGTFRYLNLIRLDAGGAMFVGMSTVPIGRLMLSPEFNINYNKGEAGEGRVKGAYYGSAAFAGNMPSWVYSSHSVGLGWAQSAGENFKLRIGGIVGGAMSHPAYDDIYFNLGAGLSMEFAKIVTVYGLPQWYFAADTPMRTAYIGYYEPKFQDVEVGIQVMLREGFVTRAFANIGIITDNYGISNEYGFKLTKMINRESVDLDIWGTLGMREWSPLLGGGVDPIIMVGISASYGGNGYRSTNSYSLSHMRDFNIDAPETDIPNSEHPGPYGFGRSGDPSFDVPINEAKQRILDSGSFAQFSGTYSGASQEEVITTARFLGAFMAQVAYANDAYDSMTTGNIFDNEIQRIAGASHEDIFNYMKAYISWYQNHGAGEQLPESLAGGIAVCAGIHSLITAYLNANGIDAFTVSVNTPNGPHMTTVARSGGKNMLLDYGNLISSEGSILDLFDAYGRHRDAPTFKSQIYGPGGEYMGTVNTSSEKLLRGAMGIDNKEKLLRGYLGVW